MSPRTVGKTTNTAWFAHALNSRPDIGRPVVAFDADESNQLSSWYAANEWAFPCHGAANRMAHQSIPAAIPEGGIGVVDVGHLENHRDVGYSVGRISDLVIVNVAPTLSDVERMMALPMRGFLDDIAPLRPDGQPPKALVLLTRCQSNTRAIKECREELEGQGWDVLSTTVPSTQRYAQTGEGAQVRPAGSAHDQLVTELLARGVL